MLPVAAAMLAIPVALATRDLRDADGGLSLPEDVKPLPSTDAMESPAFGRISPAQLQSVDAPPDRSAAVRWEAHESSTSRRAIAQSMGYAARLAPLPPMPAAAEVAAVPRGPVQADFAASRQAGFAPSAGIDALSEPVLRHASLVRPAAEIAPARSDADETAIAPALVAQGVAPVSAIALASDASPRLEYDSANLDNPPEHAPALAYDARDFDEAVTSDAAGRGPAGPASAPPAISYPDAGSEKVCSQEIS